jgi:hypothetical protein
MAATRQILLGLLACALLGVCAAHVYEAPSTEIAAAFRRHPINDLRMEVQVRRAFQQSLANSRLGSAPIGGDDFIVVDYEDLGPEGDGVLSAECLNYWMDRSIGVNINAGGPVPVNYCPFGPYGAAIVLPDGDPANPKDSAGRNCGKLLETNSGRREVNVRNPTYHSEFNVIDRMTNCTLHPEWCRADGSFIHAQNKTFWQALYLFTTAASCGLDAQAESLAGVGTIVQGVTIGDLLGLNWTQPSFFEPEIYYLSQRTNVGVKTLIRNVRRAEMLRYFNWQFTNVAQGCPDNCVSTATSTTTRTCVSVSV